MCEYALIAVRFASLAPILCGVECLYIRVVNEHADGDNKCAHQMIMSPFNADAPEFLAILLATASVNRTRRQMCVCQLLL